MWIITNKIKKMDNKHINKFDDDGLIPVGLHKFYIGHKLIYEKTYLNGLVDGFIKLLTNN